MSEDNEQSRLSEAAAQLEARIATLRKELANIEQELLVVTQAAGEVEPGGSRLVAVPELAVGVIRPPTHTIIEGDNLAALPLVAGLVERPVDMIYIDPPYNTGSKSFRYADRFRRLSSAHSEWAAFMWSRLEAAREVLADTGFIFVSIDDRELATLRTIGDRIFGERNFVATLVWHSKYTVANDSRFFSRQHEYIVVYAKEKKSARLGRLPRTEKSDAAYRNPDDDPRGPWKPTPLHAKSGNRGVRYEVRFPNGVRWSPPSGRFPRYSESRLLEMFEDNRLWFGADGQSQPAAKTFLEDVGGIVPGSLLAHSTVGHTHAANEEVAEILGKGQFDNPKPLNLLMTLIRIGAPSPDAIVLDFFAGSGTTAHAVAQLNHEQGTNRRSILCNSNENGICREVTWARVASVLTGNYPTGMTTDPLPGSLEYFRVEPMTGDRDGSSV